MNIYEIALQDIGEEGEDFTVLTFKNKYKLETGFYKKSIEFFYWLYKKEDGTAKEKEFRKSFIGRMVKFDKKCIPNYTELVFEYEKEKFSKKKKICMHKKIQLKKLSAAKQIKNNKS